MNKKEKAHARRCAELAERIGEKPDLHDMVNDDYLGIELEKLFTDTEITDCAAIAEIFENLYYSNESFSDAVNEEWTKRSIAFDNTKPDDTINSIKHFFVNLKDTVFNGYTDGIFLKNCPERFSEEDLKQIRIEHLGLFG